MGSKALGAAHVDRGLRLAGVGAILGAALLRAMVTHAPMPFWDVDPRVTPIPISDGPRTGWLLLDVLGAPLTGLGPSGSMLLDAMALLGATILWCWRASSAMSADASADSDVLTDH